jgi:L-cysteine/cystine lyase
LRRDLVEGRAGKGYFEDVLALRERARTELARLLGAPEGSVALTSSTTEACNIVVNGLRLGPDDEVVTTDLEHPGLEGVLRLCGARLRVAELRARPPEEALAAVDAEITPRTRLLALSHVAWTSGNVLPIRALCGRGIPVLVDGAQAAGAIPVDVGELGCDFYTVSAQKWLLGPDATGCLYVRPELVEGLGVSFPSFGSWKRGTWELVPGATRFETGWTPAAALEGLLESLAFAESLGAERFARALAMAERCRELLAGRVEVITESGQATLVTFRPAGDAAETVARLFERGVVVRDLPGHGWLRASVGFWTSDADLERLCEAL